MPNATDIAQLGLGTEQLRQDVAEAVALFKQVTDAIRTLEGSKASVNSLTSVIEQSKQLAAGNAQLTQSYNTLVTAQNNSVNSTKKAADAYTILKQAVKDSDAAANSALITFGKESTEYKQAADSAAAYAQQLQQVIAVQKERQQQATATPVVSTDNLAELNATQQSIGSATGSVQSPQDAQQVSELQATNQYYAEGGKAIGDNTDALAANTTAKTDNAAATKEAYSYEAEELTTLEQLAQTYIVANNELNANAVAIKANADALKAKTITEQEAFEVETKLTAEQAILKQNLASARTELTTGAKTALDAKGAYQLLNEQFIAAKTNALNIGASQGTTSQAFKTASAEAKTLGTTLKELDAEVGVNNRSVGDYNGAVDRAFGKLTSLDAVGGKLITSFGRMGIHFLAFSLAMKGIEVITEAVSSKIKEMAGDTFDSLNESVLKAIDRETQYNQTLKETNDLFDQANQNRAKFGQSGNQALQNQFGVKQAGGEDILARDTQEIDVAQKQFESAQKNLQRVSKLYGIDPNDKQKLKQELKDRLTAVEDYANGVKEIQKQLNDPEITKYADTKLYLEKELANTKSQAAVAQQVYNDLLGAATEYDTKLNTLQTGRTKKAADEAAEQRKLILAQTEFEVSNEKSKNDLIISDQAASFDKRRAALKSNAAAEIQLASAQRNNVINNPNSSEVDRTIAEKGFSEKRIEILRQEFDKKDKLTDEENLRNIAADKTTNDIRLKDQQDFYSKASQNAALSLDQQVSALEKLQDLQKQQSAADYAAELAQKKIQLGDSYSPQEKAADEAAYQQQLSDIVTKGNEQRLLIIQNYNKRTQQETTQAQNGLKASIQGLYLSDVQTSEQYSGDVKALDESLSKKEISLTEYNKKRKDLDDDYQLYALASQLAKDKKELAEVQLTQQEEFALRKKISEEEITLAEKTAADKKKIAQQLADAEKQLEQDVYAFIQTVGDAAYQRKINSYEKLKTASDTYYTTEINNIQRAASIGALTSQQAAQRTAELQAEQAAKSQEYTNKENAEKTKQARFDKAASIARIIISTIEAEAKTYAEFGFPLGVPLAITQAAIGAVEVATALATPLPTYAKGLAGGKPAHVGIYGEKGDELIEKPGFAPFIATKATLDYLPANTKITPLTGNDVNPAIHRAMMEQTAYLLTNNSADKQKAQASDEARKIAEWQTRQLVKAMKAIKPSVTIYNSSEYEKWKRGQINW